ncbi:hypothetical protein FA95DRAFT_1548641 [Auriscalpium vulgare]|uniref:Uncharacterized protein n=1 Tax=Auriscalpium vulgare TaxID=40419 RepID=A0ACB8RBH9_9AGAM|nr:hypothetical protein FA95DRAFT_1548641 [Auriscalpium vulgare]
MAQPPVDNTEILRAVKRADFPGGLNQIEKWWVKHREWLQESGYTLRRRYQADWTPSWKPGQFYPFHEDGLTTHVMDGTRSSDGLHIAIKQIPVNDASDKVAVYQRMTSEPISSDPRNRTAPLLDILHVPDGSGMRLLVMPLLRPLDKPEFETFGETIAFFTQIFEAIQLMHEHRIAHRDCTYNNIMLDPSGMYPVPFHPREINRRRDWKGKVPHLTRTQSPPRYLLIDFGLSRIYPPAEGVVPLDLPIRGGDKTVPEHDNETQRCNPFPVDVYYLGNLVRERFIWKYHGFEFLYPLVVDMVAVDPSKRPTINEVVARFKEIRASLSSWKLRSRLVRRKDWAVVSMYKSVGHWYRRLGYIISRKPAIPDA